MNSNEPKSLKPYKLYGFGGGLILGLVAGALLCGPLLSEWGMTKSILIVIASGLCFGLLGYFAISIAYASAAGGFGGTTSSNGSYASIGDGDAGGGDS